jgi:chloramphenicol-sensitive protein RarD
LYPFYYLLIIAAPADEVIAHRIFWTVVVSFAAILVAKQWKEFKAAIANRQLFCKLAGAGVLVATNWSVYVWAVLNGRVLDTSLGYFVNPLVTVLLAVFVLHERLRRRQLAALGIASCAVIVITVGYGEIPWVSLILALSFGVYSLIKNKVGADVTPLVGLTLETIPIAPFALAFIIWLQATGAGTLANVSPVHTVALLMAGAVTAIPLALFASAARRIPLSTLGLLQYICPLSQFLIGVLVFHELMPTARWIGFCLVWVALVVLTYDTWRASRKPAATEGD